MVPRLLIGITLVVALTAQAWGLFRLYAHDLVYGALGLLVGALIGAVAVFLQPEVRTSFLRNEARAGWLALALILMATLPVVSVAVILAVVLTGRRLSPPTPLEEMSEHTQPPAPPKIHRDTVAAKFMETLSTQCTLGQGQGAVRQVRTLSEYLPGYQDRTKVSRLKAFLDDPRSDAYHLAVAELARLQQLFTVQIAKAQERLRLRPSVATNRHLAELYEEYVASGLLDEGVTGYYWGLALERYAALCELDPANPRWRLKRVELMLERDQASRALAECEELLEAFPDQMDVRLRLLEIHFNAARFGALEPMRRFQELLADLGARVDPEQVEEPELKSVARFWFPPQRFPAGSVNPPPVPPAGGEQRKVA